MSLAALVDHVAHQARLDRPQGDDPVLGTVRQNLEVLAGRGDAEAAAALRGPEYPDEIDYLYGWALELHRARPTGPNGASYHTYPDIYAWAQLSGRSPTPEEVDGLLELGAVMLTPPDVKSKRDDDGL